MHIEPGDLLEFLAELLLEKGYSISFEKRDQLEYLAAASEDFLGQQQLFFPVEAKELEEKLQKICLLSEGKEAILPVLTGEDELKLKVQLEAAGNPAPQVYRFSVPERFAFYNRRLQHKNRLKELIGKTEAPSNVEQVDDRDH